MADLKKKFMEMKVADLRSELGSLGLEKTGVKTVLVDRLIKHYEETFRQSVAKEKEQEVEEMTEKDDDVGGDSVDNSMGVVVDEVLEGDQGDGGSETQANAETVDVEKEKGGIENETVQSDNQDVKEGNEEEVETVADTGEEVGEGEAVEMEDEENQYDVEDGGEEVEEGNENENNEACDEEVGGDEEVAGNEEEEEQNNENNEVEALTIAADDTNDDVIQINQENEEEPIAPPPEFQEEAGGSHEETETGATSQAEPPVDTSNISASSNNEAENHDNSVQAPVEEVDENKIKEKVKEAERERLTILVTGLSPDTTANDLKSFFRQYGKIGRIKIMTNTRVPGSQRFAHVCASNMDDLQYFIEKLNGMTLNGKTIRLTKAPGDGSVSESYKIAVATELEEANAKASEKTKGSGGGDGKDENADAEENKAKSSSDAKDTDSSSDIQVIQESSSSSTAAKKSGNEQESEKKADSSPEKKKDVKESATSEDSGAATTEKKSPEKGARGSNKPPQRPRKESHDRNRNEEHVRPHYNQRNPRQFRRGGGREGGDYRRHNPHHRPIEKIHRDRPPMGRGHAHNADRGGRRRSPHAQLNFDQIREIRDEQRRRDSERRKREEERERAAEVERQKRLEYQNYMEFKNLEREREKLRLERERIEREKLELIKLERERQKAERDRIEKEKEELRRAKMNIEHSHRSTAVKRSYDEDPRERRRSEEERKKPYSGPERVRIDGVKTEAERKMSKERYDRVPISASVGRSRSPGREATGIRESRRDVWARDTRVGSDRNRSDERTHRRNSASDRRGREAPSRVATGSADTSSRYVMESAHSSGRSGGSSSKRTSDRYEEPRREAEWIQRSSYLSAGSSLSSLPLAASSSVTRDSWPMTDRKIEAWDTARLQPRTEPWISGAVGSGVAARSSLPSIPAPPIYSHGAVSLNLQSTGLGGLGSYPSTSDRYDGYKGFHHLRRF